MEGEVLEIPMRVPLPIPLSPTINLEPYIPKILHRYKYYVIYVCRTCRISGIFCL